MPKTKRQTSKTKNRGGRPPKFSSPEELETAVNKYFTRIKRSRLPPTISGLMRHLDIAEYRTFHDYEAKPRFTQVLKKARLQILEAHETHLFSPSCTGSIFYLKCHGGDMFKERPQQHEHSGRGGGPIEFEIDWSGPDEVPATS